MSNDTKLLILLGASLFLALRARQLHPETFKEVLLCMIVNAILIGGIAALLFL